ncbi:MAG: HupE/UreJ family protein [Verrucomicrobia bacterium]|nr:HupE/UreJ family protein [Verrucomicrobiota bacterium]
MNTRPPVVGARGRAMPGAEPCESPASRLLPDADESSSESELCGLGILRQLVFLFGLGAALASPAHTPDTSYCRIAIGREAVAFTFTFDLATLARMTRVDADADGRITRAELQAATPAIESFLRRSVYVELNERDATFGPLTPPTWAPDAGDAIAAADQGQRLATLTFRNPVLHAPDSVALTFDFFGSLGERHTVLGTFVWSGQENPVIFTRFEPDYLFDTGYRVPALDQFREYLWLGVTHIFLGYDHVAFLLALFFVRQFRELVKIITAFSVAHTLTLALAALGVFALPSRLVESAIAGSIIYVAAENLWRADEALHRWRVTFAFGLVHGFGFANVLRELGLPAEGLVRSLLAFNLGVELGQLAIAAVCWPLLRWIGRRRWAGRVRTVVSGTLLAFGAAWLIERAFALRFMPW